MTGQIPVEQIDHIDMNKANNRFVNLREATRSENYRNRTRYSNNKSGFKGVCFYPPTNKWTAQITHLRKAKRIGYFDTPEEAHAAYCKAAQRLHGEFARTA